MSVMYLTSILLTLLIFWQSKLYVKNDATITTLIIVVTIVQFSLWK